MLDHFAQSLRVELDFRQEADAMEEMSRLLGTELGGSGPEGVPRAVHPPSPRPGAVRGLHPRRHAIASTASGIDRDALARQLLQSMLDQVLRLGFFHADPHPGNIFVFADGTLGLIDFGAVGRLDPIQQAAVVDMLAAPDPARRRPAPGRASSGWPR